MVTKDALLRALGRRIADARRTRGLTQKTVANRAGISIGYLALIERGRRNPPYLMLVEIANGLGVSTADIV